MTFINARPVPQAQYGTGISCRTVSRKDGVKSFILNMTGGFQEENFGYSIAGKPVKVEIGRGTDSGLLKVLVVEKSDADLVAAKSMKASARIKCRAWDTLGEEDQKSAPCKVVEKLADGIVIRLPKWAAGKSKMEAEFGLKPIKKGAA